VASRPAGGHLRLHGHGRRARQLRGPAAPTAPPSLLLVEVRRFRCTQCRSTVTVGPRELLTRRLFSAAAIGLALALFGLLDLSAGQVRARVSPWKVVGAGSALRWDSLLRWTRTAARGRLFEAVRPTPDSWTAREIAARSATTLAAHALPSPEPPQLEALAFFGAARAA
jgi:hypothetical protein